MTNVIAKVRHITQAFDHNDTQCFWSHTIKCDM